MTSNVSLSSIFYLVGLNQLFSPRWSWCSAARLLEWIKSIVFTVSESSAVRLCDTVSPAALNARSLAVLDAGIDSTRRATLANLGSFVSCDFHQSSMETVDSRVSKPCTSWNIDCFIILPAAVGKFPFIVEVPINSVLMPSLPSPAPPIWSCHVFSPARAQVCHTSEGMSHRNQLLKAGHIQYTDTRPIHCTCMHCCYTQWQ